MALRELEIIQKGRSTYDHLEGFLYNSSLAKGEVKYWKCRRKRLTTVANKPAFIFLKYIIILSHETKNNMLETFDEKKSYFYFLYTLNKEITIFKIGRKLK